jgi:non-specific serine/threonine protein kinase
MSVIDELYENRDATELSFALDEKFERLREFKHIPEIAAPVDLQPILRPYQLAGYQWLNYLNDVGWGGIWQMIWVWVKQYSPHHASAI